MHVKQEKIIKNKKLSNELNTILDLNNQTTVDSVIEIKPKDQEKKVIQKVLNNKLPISNKEFYQKTLDLFNI